MTIGSDGLLRMFGLGERRFGKREIVVLCLAIFMPLAGASLSGLPGLTGDAPAVDVSAIPHLAEALGLTERRVLSLVPVKHTPTVGGAVSSVSNVLPSGPPVNPVVITYGAGGSGTQGGDTLAVPANGLVPGSIAERRVILRNAGSVTISAISLVAASPTPDPLISNTSYGLQLRVMRCAVPWATVAASNGAYTYSCPGSETATNFVPVANVLNSPEPLSGLNAVNPGGVDNLVLELSFPLPAPSTLGGLSSAINWSFDASGL